MHLAPPAITPPTDPFVPDVKAAPRPFVDAVAFNRLDEFFDQFRPTTVSGAAFAIIEATDRDRDGVVTQAEASFFAVEDQYTSFHQHNGNFLERSFVAAQVIYDASALVDAADANADARLDQAELGAYLARRTPMPGDDVVRAGDKAHKALLDATNMVRVREFRPRYEHTVRMPW